MIEQGRVACTALLHRIDIVGRTDAFPDKSGPTNHVVPESKKPFHTGMRSMKIMNFCYPGKWL